MSEATPDSQDQLPNEVSAKDERYARYVLFVLTLVYAINYLDRQILAVLLEPIKGDLGVSDTAMGFLMGTAFAVFYAIAGIPIARLADRLVRRNVLGIAIVVWSLMTAACGSVASFGQLALARIGVAVGEAGGTPTSHSLISDYFQPYRRATMLGLYSSAPLIGSMVGYSVGGWLNDEIGWRNTFFAIGLPGIAVAALVFLTVREPPRGRFDPPNAAPPKATSSWETFRILWADLVFRRVSLALGFATFVGLGFGTWSPAFLMRVHGMSTSEVGFFLGSVAPFGMIGAIGAGWLGDRLARRDMRWYAWLPAISLMVALPFQAIMVLSDDRSLVMSAWIPSSLIGGMFAPLSYAIVQNSAPPHMRASASAIMLLFLNLIGLGCGPQAVGILSDLLQGSMGDLSLRYALLLAKVMTVIAALLYWAAARAIPPGPAPEPT